MGISRKSSALDLLAALLTYDPRTRITAAQALQHPYFQEVCVCVRACARVLQIDCLGL